MASTLTGLNMALASRGLNGAKAKAPLEPNPDTADRSPQ